jgi:hypothetical protein
MDFAYNQNAINLVTELSTTSNLELFKNGRTVNIDYYVNGFKQTTFTEPLTLSFEVTNFEFTDDTSPYDLSIFKYFETEKVWKPVGGTYNPINGIISVKRMSLSQYTLLKSKKTFNDLEDSDAKDAINKLLNKGVIKSEENFNPKSELSREEFISWIASAYGLDNNAGKSVPFTDVSLANEYYNDIAIVYTQGIISGKSATSFKPKESITKQEMAKIISNSLKNYDNKASNKALTNKLLASQPSVQDWSKDNVAMLMGLGIMTNDDLKSLDQPVTKEQAALMINAVYN